MAASTYNPNDPTQAAFLAALAKGESPTTANPALSGYGNVNLAGASTDQYGFPQWSGAVVNGSPTHAAGIYQFQPSTWDSVASEYGLNFQNPADQSAAAWNLAANTYAANNGGASLESALASGNYASVANTLGSTWTSLSANELSSAFSSGAANPTGAAASGGTSTASGGVMSTIANALGIAQIEETITNLFVRGGVFVLGFLLIAFGLYYLADKASDGAISDGVKSAAKSAAAA